jgi:hypothetical protein
MIMHITLKAFLISLVSVSILIKNCNSVLVWRSSNKGPTEIIKPSSYAEHIAAAGVSVESNTLQNVFDKGFTGYNTHLDFDVRSSGISTSNESNQRFLKSDLKIPIATNISVTGPPLNFRQLLRKLYPKQMRRSFITTSKYSTAFSLHYEVSYILWKIFCLHHPRAAGCHDIANMLGSNDEFESQSLQEGTSSQLIYEYEDSSDQERDIMDDMYDEEWFPVQYTMSSQNRYGKDKDLECACVTDKLLTRFCASGRTEYKGCEFMYDCEEHPRRRRHIMQVGPRCKSGTILVERKCRKPFTPRCKNGTILVKGKCRKPFGLQRSQQAHPAS